VRIGAVVLAAALALVAAGCGGDDGSTTTDAEKPAKEKADGKPSGEHGGQPKPATGLDIEAKSAPGRAIERTTESWAPLFAASADKWGCRYMTQPGCAQVACASVATGPIEDCKPASAALRRAFEDATVESIKIEGDRATAELSNGKAVGLVLLGGHEAGDLWRIDQVAQGGGS